MAQEPDAVLPPSDGPGQAEDAVVRALQRASAGGRRRQTDRFVLAALSSIPWVGGVLSAAAALDAEREQTRVNDLHREWLEEHKRKLAELARDLADVVARVEEIGEGAAERLQSEAYLGVVTKAFRVWDAADTREKRKYLRRLLSNAAGTKLCSDDVVRLFVEWIDHYHEIHFAVIRLVYRNPGITRAGIWREFHGGRVREDSAEADLFRLVVRDLSTGDVIRQHRDKDWNGAFLKKPRQYTPKGQGASTLKSAFDDIEPYELTELGRQFVHYVMNDLVPRVGAQEADRGAHGTAGESDAGA
ncbi:MAG: hypothetical protein U0599_08230 [Vicinamibacteria bacterium]